MSEVRWTRLLKGVPLRAAVRAATFGVVVEDAQIFVVATNASGTVRIARAHSWASFTALDAVLQKCLSPEQALELFGAAIDVMPEDEALAGVAVAFILATVGDGSAIRAAFEANDGELALLETLLPYAPWAFIQNLNGLLSGELVMSLRSTPEAPYPCVHLQARAVGAADPVVLGTLACCADVDKLLEFLQERFSGDAARLASGLKEARKKLPADLPDLVVRGRAKFHRQAAILAGGS